MQSIVFLAVLGMTYSQKGVYLDEKVRNLQEWMYRRPLITLNTDRWKTYVRSAPRNYSMVVMFTALSPNVDCAVCKSAYDEFYILANSYRYAYPELKALYFAIIDYGESPEIFQQMNLDVVPVLFHFPSKGTKKKLTKWILNGKIRVLRPPNYAAPAVVLLLAMLVLGLLYMRRNNLDFLYNRTSWALICLCVVFAFMSGQMWNHIHGPPFVMTSSHTREISFIHGSTQYQLVAETYLVAILYAAITAGFILMNDAADGKGDFGRRRIMAFVGLGLVVVFFSLLLSIFRSKYQGYPYSFLFH
ncbi:hypothetical protein LOAG_02854 [Loa loa]|uniref:Magnesium transporter protein 1 n=1 Tax=Loa loa TaxID=7209 RepID=A0A1S0U6I1_LOALO|nr:hypothetical protein LOAG_02854 [Loa loa]EFO25633.1 hypothetical protein LOAG_02854 [Loa loa]